MEFFNVEMDKKLSAGLWAILTGKQSVRVGGNVRAAMAKEQQRQYQLRNGYFKD